jgi:hypothetical protein
MRLVLFSQPDITVNSRTARFRLAFKIVLRLADGLIPHHNMEGVLPLTHIPPDFEGKPEISLCKILENERIVDIHGTLGVNAVKSQLN